MPGTVLGFTLVEVPSAPIQIGDVKTVQTTDWSERIANRIVTHAQDILHKRGICQANIKSDRNFYSFDADFLKSEQRKSLAVKFSVTSIPDPLIALALALTANPSFTLPSSSS